MTFEEYWGEDPDPGKITAKHAWNAGQQAEREKYQELIAAAEAVVDYCNYLGVKMTSIDNLLAVLGRIKEKAE